MLVISRAVVHSTSASVMWLYLIYRAVVIDAHSLESGLVRASKVPHAYASDEAAGLCWQAFYPDEFRMGTPQLNSLS